MSKKFLLIFILFFILLTTFGFSKNEVSVTYVDGMISVQTRISRFIFDGDRASVNEIFLIMEMEKKIFVNGNDGYNLFVNGEYAKAEKILINGQSVEEITGKTLKIDDDIELEFSFGEFSQVYTIYNGPYYQLDVEVRGNIPENVSMVLPRVGDETFDRVNENGTVLTSYNQKYQSLIVSEIIGKGVNFRLDGSKNVNTLSVSHDGLYIKGYVGPVRKMSYMDHLFPDNYIWLSRLLNGYPGASDWWDPIQYMFIALFDWLFDVTKNYGWAIILFAIIVKTAMLPLSHAQNTSMIKRRKLENDPEYKKIMKITDKQKQQMAMMKFYKEKKVSLAGGCLPMLIQLPLLMLLYQVVRYQSELFAYGPNFLIWTDLAVGGFAENILLILISMAVTFFTSMLTSAEPKMVKQGLMFMFMPILFIGLPTALQLYWVTQTLYQFATTYYVYKKNDIHGVKLKEFIESFKKQ